MSDLLDRLFPRPQKVQRGEGWLTLAAAGHPCPLIVSPSAHPLEKAAAELLQATLPGTFHQVRADEAGSDHGVVVGLLDGRREGARADELPANSEAYRLVVDDRGVNLLGQGPAGTLYAAETFLQLVRRESDRILLPRLAIDDWPDYRYRGLYVEGKWGTDLMTLDDWKELIDLLARWKFNSLSVGIYCCWGLQYPGQMTEWVMVPFPRYPKLRTPKDIRYYSPAAGQHVHARYLPALFEDDLFGEVVAHGRTRNVIVRPHFNGPGHNTVIPREYPEVSARDEAGNPTSYGYCLTSDATYALLFDLYDSVIERYLRPNGVTWWHLATDEVYPVNGIDPNDELRPVDPWCKCPGCRVRSHEQLLLDFAFRCLHHLREAGMDNITVWHDCLERLHVVDEFGARLETEGLKPYVILEWWRYRDPVPSPRSDVSRTWVTPMAGYYHWMFHGSYLFNIAPFLQRGYASGSEGAEAYCTFDYAYQRNYLALSEWAWNKDTSGSIYDFEAKYARWLFPEDVTDGTEALYKLYQVFGSTATKAMLDNLIYYWYSYPARRIDFPREIYRHLLVDRTRTLTAIQACVPPLEEAVRLFSELRERAADRRAVDEFVLESRRALGVIGAYTHGLLAIQSYQQAVHTPTDARVSLDRAVRESRAALGGVESVLAEFERVKPAYLRPQGMRDLTYIRDFAAALRDELQAAARHAEAGGKLSETLAVMD
ncbi:MAG TPA: family 20 glycosylhydrolase [Chloroflexota bacterium]|nr:family 20 glycosylhydrolase [Chloroflexota bacterium]